MPARVSRSSLHTTEPKTVRTRNRKRDLDAYSAAAKLIPSETGVRQNRLGEYLDDSSKSKRRRTAQESDEENEHSAEDTTAKKAGGRAVNDENAEYGSDSDGNEWMLGGLREDDEDSEIDSDEAFGESDDERFAEFRFRGSSSSSNRQKRAWRQYRKHEHEGNVDLQELDSLRDEEDDDFGNDGVDLATMLDDGEDEADVEENSAGDQDDDESFSESADDSDEGDVEVQSERTARMRDRIDGLNSAYLPIKPESEPGSTTLTVDDLLADLEPSARKQYEAPLKTRKQSERPKTLAAPLAPRQRDQMNRDVASEKAKRQLDRWRDTVMHNRRAEFLSFPHLNLDHRAPLGKDQFAQNVPQNELESHIRQIMEDSGLVSRLDQEREQEDEEATVIKSEELAEKKAPIEEVARRRAELRRARDLLFREEIKAKRIAKIKSKSYRRVHRREKERSGAQDASDYDDEDVQARADRQRAEARMSTKHKDSKWAKSLKATDRIVWDDEARNSVNEQARRNEELRERIVGKGLHEDGQSDTDSDGEPDEFGEDGDISRSIMEMDQFQRHGRDATASSGLGGMKFMLAAEERRRTRNDEDIEQLRRDLAVRDDEKNRNEEDIVSEQELGRATFGPEGREISKPEQSVERPELEEGHMSDDEERPDQEREQDHLVIKTNEPDRGGDRPLSTRDTNDWNLVPYKSESVSDAGHDSEIAEMQTKLPDEQQKIPHHRRAFAGDNVKAAFDAEKIEAIASDEEKEISNHLPGWGSWTGEGLSKSVRKGNNRQRHNPIYKTKVPGVRAQGRKDANLENVLISEKQDRKGKKYKADILPHEFEKKQQYERSLRLPVGPEWVTKETFQKHTRPRVVVKPGVIIAPMERPLL